MAVGIGDRACPGGGDEIPHPSRAPGTSRSGSTGVFPGGRTEPGQSYVTLIQGSAHESSASFVAILRATPAGEYHINLPVVTFIKADAVIHHARQDAIFDSTPLW
jgi:hypothetical protein